MRPRTPASAFYKTWAVCALALIVAASCICGSKIAPLITVAIGLVFLLLATRVSFGALPLRGSAQGLTRRWPSSGPWQLIIWGAGMGVTQDRWQRLLNSSGDATLTDRLQVDQACLSGAANRGCSVSGRERFRRFFRRIQDRLIQPPPGRWIFAHDDYIQTALEWGALGRSGMVALLFRRAGDAWYADCGAAIGGGRTGPAQPGCSSRSAAWRSWRWSISHSRSRRYSSISPSLPGWPGRPGHGRVPGYFATKIILRAACLFLPCDSYGELIVGAR